MKTKITLAKEINIIIKMAVRLLPLLLLIYSSACTVTNVYVKPGYETKERHSLKRIALGIEPHNYKIKDIGSLLLLIKKDFISLKKNYILQKPATNPRQKPQEVCQANPRLHGILMTSIERLELDGDSTKLAFRLYLHDCNDVRIWEARGKKSYSSSDKNLQNVTSSYVNRISEEIRPYAAGSYHLLNMILESLPDPLLTEDEELEKIDSL